MRHKDYFARLRNTLYSRKEQRSKEQSIFVTFNGPYRSSNLQQCKKLLSSLTSSKQSEKIIVIVLLNRSLFHGIFQISQHHNTCKNEKNITLIIIEIVSQFLELMVAYKVLSNFTLSKQSEKITVKFLLNGSCVYTFTSQFQQCSCQSY